MAGLLVSVRSRHRHRPRLRATHAPVYRRKGPAWTESEAPSAPSALTNELQVLAWILALPVLVTATGMIVASTIFVTLWLRRRSGERWAVSIASGLATAAALWILGATVLEGLPRGGLLWSLAAVR